ncbi:MAG: ATP-binding cassette domain-containing protein, partial [Terriglobales bacterium]
MSLTFDCGFVHAGRRGFALELAFVTGEGITALCGPSGSGKTTAVHLIAGLLTPARGRIALGERVLFDAAAGVNLPPERRGLGIVFQDSLLFPHRSVAENLTYGLA